MKRIIFLLLLLVSLTSASAQVYKYKTTEIAYKIKTDGLWSEWSEWKTCDILTVINLDKEVISIYSQEVQEYDIVKSYDVEYDDDGGQMCTFVCVNEDGLRCNIRLRVQEDNQLQLYVDFKDMMWVYNIRPRN